jgi:O-antigen/teichoic acid export membrane protein
VLFPAMSNYSGIGEQDKMRRLFFIATRYLAFVAFPVGISGTILAYQIIHYLYGHEYIGAQRILQVMFCTSIITSLCGPGSAVLYGFEKQSFIYKLGGIMAIVNLVLDFFLIKKFGAIGAVVCYSATTIIGSTLGTIYTCRTMQLRYPFASIAKIFVSTVIMGIAMELIILRNGEIPGFVFSVLAGCIIYIVSSLVLGTFETEDYTIMESIKGALPGKSKWIVDNMIRFLASFKNNTK